MNKATAEKWGLIHKCVHPLLVSPRYSKFFTLNKKDWEQIRKRGKTCYVFLCHKPKSKLADNILDYIKWGETQCITKSGKVASNTLASKMREQNSKNFFGWYDMSGIANAVIFMPRYAYYGHNFMMPQFPIAINESLIALIPKEKLDETQYKAIVTYLNSAFNRFYIEINGRPGALKGGVALDLKQVLNMMIINVRKFDSEQIKSLRNIFDKLEFKTREIGGAHTRKSMEKLQPMFDEVDAKVAQILGFNEQMKAIKEITKLLMERRLSRAKEAKPEVIKGEEEPRIRPPKKPKRTKREDTSIPLDRFFTK